MDSATYKEIKSLFDEYIEMYSSRNDQLTDHFSPDFSGFAGGSNTLVKDMEEWIAVTRQDFAQIRDRIHIDIKDIAIQSLSEDVAVATSFFTIKLPIEDDYFSRETVRLVLIFHRREGKWKIAHSSISVPYGLVGKGEIYPLKGLEERNKLLEQIISERTKELEEANSSLKESEMRYRRLFEAAKDGILILDAETGMIVDVNPYLLSMLGYSHEQFLGKKVWELGFLKKTIANKDNFLELQQKRYVRYEDIPLESSNGRQIDVEFVSNLYEVDHQHVIQCNIRNISERKHAEKNLKASEEKLRTIFDTMFEGVALNEIIYDKKGEMIDYRILEVNDAFYKTADFTPGKVVGSCATELYYMSPESIKAFWESHKNETKVEHKEMCSPLNKRYYSIWTSPFVNNRFVTSFVDITEQKHVEDTLKERDAMLRAMFESSKDAIGVSKRGIHIYVNPSYLKLFGFESVESIVGKSIVDTIAPSDRQRIIRNIELRAAKESVSTFYEARGIRVDGTEFDAEINVSTYELNGEVYSIGVMRDISARKQAEAQLVEREEQYRQLIDQMNNGIMVCEVICDDTGQPIDHRLVHGNAAFEKMTGVSVAEQRGRTSKDFSIGWTPDILQRLYRVAMTGEPIEYERYNETLGRFYATRVFSPRHGQFAHVFTDITRQKQSEEILKRYQLLSENTRDIILYIRANDLQILEANHAALLAYGYSREELQTKSIRDLRDPETLDTLPTQITLASGEGTTFKTRHLRHDGTTFPVEVSSRGMLHGKERIILSIIRDISERAQEEQKAAHLAAIVESSDEVIISTALDGVITSWNAGAEKIYGYNQGEIVGRPISILFPPDRANEMVGVLETIRSGKRLTRFETVRQGKSGQLIDMSLTVSPIKDTEGNITGVSTIGSDITVHKRAEKALRESEERFHRLFDVSPDAFLVFDPFSDANDWPILDCNESACKMNGYTREELIGKSIYLLDPIQETPEGRAAYLKTIRQGEILRFESTHRHRDGHIFPIEVSNSIMTFQGRELVLGIDRDITDRKRAEQQISDTLEYIQTIFDASPIGIVTFKESGEVISANNAATAILGGTIDQLLKHNFRTLKSMERSGLQAAAIAALSSGHEKNVEVHHISTFGKDLWLSARFVPFSHQAQIQLLLLLSDITERKQVEEALRHAQKLESIGTLAGGIAHDFNNLLNAMLGQSTLAMSKLSSASPARYHLEKSIQAADRAADLTRQLLAYSGRGKFVTETIGLNRIVEENAQLLRVSVPKTVQVLSELDSSNPRIHGDGGQIQQVIMNLIINASEAMGSNPGCITVRTDNIELSENDTTYSKYTNDPLPRGKYVLLRVADSGGGMSSETLGRIFDPFFSTKFTGRGLGLAAVLGIIRGHKGGVRIESEVGKGTTFEIIFPLLDDVATPEKQEIKEEVSFNGAGRKVLVIDDEESVVELLADVFTDANFNVLQTMNPIEGIELYRKHQHEISIVILDYSMPDMDGKTAFKELAKINKNVKVLLCSGYTEEEMQSGFGKLRPAGFIKKPYRPPSLLARVSKILSE